MFLVESLWENSSLDSCIKKNVTRGWRDDSVVESTCCSSRGPGPDSPASMSGGLQKPVTPLHSCVCTCVHTHRFKKIK